MKKKNLRELGITALCLAMLVFSITGCSDVGVMEAEKAIDAIGEVTLSSGSVIENADEKYGALSEEKKRAVDNLSVLQDAKKRYAELQYSQIKSKIEEANTLLSSYFAQYYDTSGIKAAVATAEEVVANSQSDRYGEVLSSLESELGGLNDYIEEESSNSYSTANGPTDAPFSVDESAIPSAWSFKPVAKQTGLNPDWITSTDDYDADPHAVIPFIQGSGRPYSFTISTIPTKKIVVQAPDGGLYDAYVNTEVDFEQLQKESVNRDKNRELVERPGYFLMTRQGALALALQDFNGEDYYVIYGQ